MVVGIPNRANIRVEEKCFHSCTVLEGEGLRYSHWHVNGKKGIRRIKRKAGMGVGVEVGNT